MPPNAAREPNATREPSLTAEQDRAEVEPPGSSLVVSTFDEVTSLFSALIILLGVLVVTMFIAWLTSHPSDVKMSVLDKRALPTATPTGFQQDFEIPSESETELLSEPKLSEVLAYVSTAASREFSMFDAQQSDSKRSQGSPSDNRVAPGHERGEENAIGRWERWEIRFHAKNRDEYARQLDFFRIELGVFGGGINVIETASAFSGRPTRSINKKPRSEKRLYFSWKSDNPLSRFDARLLANAGIDVTNRNIVRFIPTDLEEELAVLEKEYCEAKGKEFPGEIAKTVFETRESDLGYEFVILLQRYRSARSVKH